MALPDVLIDTLLVTVRTTSRSQRWAPVAVEAAIPTPSWFARAARHMAACKSNMCECQECISKMRSSAPCPQQRIPIRAEPEDGDFTMNVISRSFPAVGALALVAALLTGTPTLANARDNDLAKASHGVYPPSADKSTQPSGQVLYQFVPGGERYHVVTPATTQTGTANSPAPRS
jgi:hypothetical protein